MICCSSTRRQWLMFHHVGFPAVCPCSFCFWLIVDWLAPNICSHKVKLITTFWNLKRKIISTILFPLLQFHWFSVTFHLQTNWIYRFYNMFTCTWSCYWGLVWCVAYATWLGKILAGMEPCNLSIYSTWISIWDSYFQLCVLFSWLSILLFHVTAKVTKV